MTDDYGLGFIGLGFIGYPGLIPPPPPPPTLKYAIYDDGNFAINDDEEFAIAIF